MSAATLRAVAAAALATAVLAAVPAHAVNPYKPAGGPALRLVVTAAGATFALPSGSTTCTTFTLGGVVESPGTARTHSVRAGYLGTLTSGGCGTVTITPTGTWDVVVPGDQVGTAWPMTLANATAQGSIGGAGCVFDIAGAVTGKFDTTTQRFTATSSTLVVEGVAGPLCTIVDILEGDTVAVSGTWTNLPPAGSGPLTLGH